MGRISNSGAQEPRFIFGHLSAFLLTFHQVHPHGMRTDRERRKFEKDRRRWRHADKNGDEKVTKHEFKYFLFPQLSPDSGAVTIPEAFSDLDTDFDGRISFDEFLAVYTISEDWDEQVKQHNPIL